MNKSMAKPALFLDRDGTIIRDKGYIKSTRDAVIYDFTVKALTEAQKHFDLFIISNQSGIAKGLLTVRDAGNINKFIMDRLKSKGVRIKEALFCPHAKEENCRCRKPSPFFIKQLAKKHRLDIRRSWIIGDHLSDVETAKNASCRGVYILTGHGRKHYRDAAGSYPVKKNLLTAVRYILSAAVSGKTGRTGRM